jgi:hypothetical protein
VSFDRERRARNEALFREVNERVEEISNRLSGFEDEQSTLTGFVCECSRESCTELIEITPARYEAVRSDPRRFIVLPGHEDLSVERVVEKHPGVFVVEKFGDASDVAIKRDPRA